MSGEWAKSDWNDYPQHPEGPSVSTQSSDGACDELQPVDASSRGLGGPRRTGLVEDAALCGNRRCTPRTSPTTCTGRPTARTGDERRDPDLVVLTRLVERLMGVALPIVAWGRWWPVVAHAGQAARRWRSLVKNRLNAHPSARVRWKRSLAALVQSACNKPGSSQITHDHVRSGHGAWMAGPCRIPKLTVRDSIPVTRSTRDKRCHIYELGAIFRLEWHLLASEISTRAGAPTQ